MVGVVGVVEDGIPLLLGPTFRTEGRGHSNISFAQCPWVLAITGCAQQQRDFSPSVYLCLSLGFGKEIS